MTDSAPEAAPALDPKPVHAPLRVRARLAYTLEPNGQQEGACLDNPLVDLLAAVTEGGSIKAAASRLGASYRHVWGLLRHWEGTLGEPLVSWSQGQPARLTSFAQRFLIEERRARVRMQPHIEALRADLERAAVIASGMHSVLSLRASHDLALPILQQHLASSARMHLEIGFSGSVDSLKALSERQCLIAGFHVPLELASSPVFTRALLPWLQPRTHRLIPCARRIQGLMMRPEHADRVASLSDAARLRLRFVSRQAGSGTRLLIDHLLHREGLVPGALGEAAHIEHTHVAVALCVASGMGDIGMGIEAAAVQLGLHFVPLVREDYFLAVATRDLEHPGLLQLRDVLADRPWRSILMRLRGYEPPAEPGALQHLEQAFPGWPARERSATSRGWARSRPG